jgi:membrane-associated phospholipid phosphatase
VKRWTAALAPAGLACLLAVVSWQVIAGGPLTAQDMPVHQWVLRHPGARSSPLWAALGELGDARVTLPVLAAAGAVVWWRRAAAWPLLLPAIALGLFTVVLETMKIVIGRSAPAGGSDAVFAGGGEFPSGHTATATLLCAVIVYLAFCAAGREARLACDRACLLAGAVAGACAGTAMVAMDYHWLTDVAGGWLLGLLVLQVMLLARRSWPRRPQRGRQQPHHRQERRPQPEAAEDRSP